MQGRLDRDEFDLRVSQALASRTYAELSAVTADLPPGLAAAKPPAPARVQNNRGVLRPVVALTVATAVYAGTWPVALSLPVSGPDHDPHAGVALAGTAFIVYLIFLVVTVMVLIDSRQQRRSGKQLPPGSAPGAGGPASPGCRHPARIISFHRLNRAARTPPRHRASAVRTRHCPFAVTAPVRADGDRTDRQPPLLTG